MIAKKIIGVILALVIGPPLVGALVPEARVVTGSIQSAQANAVEEVIGEEDDASPRVETSDEVTDGPVTRGGWGAALLDNIGAPQCEDNMRVMVAWQTQEGTTAAWNPLGTTIQGYATKGGDFNSHGVKEFIDLETGIAATRDTIYLSAYATALERFRACAPAADTAQAIRDSPWCAECTNGRYLIDTLASANLEAAAMERVAE